MLNKSVVFLHANNEQTKKEFRKTIQSTRTSKSITQKQPRYKLNQGGERPLESFERKN
jgi:hypothetical protein